MPELNDVLPGETIETVWGNAIRDRTWQRYVDATARDAAEPLPETGEVAYLTATGTAQHFDGTVWRSFIDDRGGSVDVLDVNGPVQVSSSVTMDAAMIQKNPTPTGDFDQMAAGFTSPDVWALRHSSDGVAFSPFYAYDEAADVHSFYQSAGGAPRFVFDVGANQFKPTSTGTAAAPAYSWSGNEGTGMWKRGDGIAFSVDGYEVTRLGDEVRYEATNNPSVCMRNIFVTTQLPGDAWGKPGDVAIRIN